MKKQPLSISKKKVVSNDFADFFHHASEEEKIKVFTQAAKMANQDQRNLVKQYKKLSKKTS